MDSQNAERPVAEALNREDLHDLAANVAAIFTAKRWAMIPLEPSGNKEPYFQLLPGGSWRSLAVQPASEETIRDWFRRRPDMQVGIATGRVSDLVVADIDFGEKKKSNGPAVPDELLDLLSELDTPIVLTPNGGLHVYLRPGSEEQTKNTVLELGGLTVEMKGDMGYVQAPPSRGYEYLHDSESLVSVETFTQKLSRFGTKALTPRGIPLGVKASLGGSSGGQAYVSKPLSDLALWDGDEDFVRDAARVLGIPGKVGRKFKCVLPGHEEEHASANLWRDQRGIFVYRDHHQASGRASYALAQVYASQVAGRVVTPGSRSLVLWKKRLLWKTGRFELPEDEIWMPVMPALPAGATSGVRKVLDGLVLLLRFRWLDSGVNVPIPFTASFGAPWCGVSESTFHRAKGWMIEKKLLVKIDELELPGKRPTSLWTLATHEPPNKDEMLADLWGRLGPETWLGAEEISQGG